ncbi:MAG: hypothetical protein WC749_02295 [Dehalococcoidia bacterium]
MSSEDMKALLAKISEEAKKAQELKDIRHLRRALSNIWVEAGRVMGS